MVWDALVNYGRVKSAGTLEKLKKALNVVHTKHNIIQIHDNVMGD